MLSVIAGGLALAIAENHAEIIRCAARYLKPDFFVVHDDWGTEKSLFIGRDTWKEIIYPVTRVIYEAVKETGVPVIQHSCGKMEPFLPDTARKVYYRRWDAASPKADIVFFHGVGEYSGLYHRFAHAMHHAGCSVWAPDHIGHGSSDGSPSACYSLSALLENSRLFYGRPEWSDCATIKKRCFGGIGGRPREAVIAACLGETGIGGAADFESGDEMTLDKSGNSG